MEETICDGKQTIIYDIARPGDVVEVTEFSSKYYFNSSPIRELSSFDDPTDEAGKFAWKQERIQNSFSRPTSIIVREKTGRNVVAFQAMIIEDRNNTSINNEDEIDFNSADRSPGWLFRAFFTQLNRNVNLFARYEVDRILFLRFGAVRTPETINAKFTFE